MKHLLTAGLITLGVLSTQIKPAAADWVSSPCSYEIANQTSRRVYFFLNTQRTSLASGEKMKINTCDSTPFPRLGLFQSNPLFARPTIIFDSKLGNGYTLKTRQLYPGKNTFTESGLKLNIQ